MSPLAGSVTCAARSRDHAPLNLRLAAIDSDGSMPRRYIFLAGAPARHSLCWDEDKLLKIAVAPFAEAPPVTESPVESVKWRVLAASSRCAETRGQVQGGRENRQDTHTDELSRIFYDHSVTVHEALDVSTTDTGDESTTNSSACSTKLASAGTGICTTTCPLLVHGRIRDLSDLPSARHLDEIVPQTITVNLAVSVLSAQPPRRVTTKVWKREMDIVELAVADETSTGFGVTIWLQPPGLGRAAQNEDDALRQTLACLRPRDIVLLRTVGLRSFRDRVYGQSLRRGMTTVDLLHRQPVDLDDAEGIYSSKTLNAAPATDDYLLAKVRRVRQWVLQFAEEAGNELVPPDTPVAHTGPL